MARPFSESNLEIVDAISMPGSTVEVEQYQSLTGVPPGADTLSIFYRQKLGILLKRLKITLVNGKFRTQAGALHYMFGDITMNAKPNLKPGKRVKPTYSGTGVVFLEPTWGHYVLVPVDGVVYVDRGLWVAIDGNLKARRSMIKGSAAIFGGEGLFQTKIEGKGSPSGAPSSKIVIADCGELALE